MKVGIITGSGTHTLPGFEPRQAFRADTRHGSVDLTSGVFAGIEVVHLSRHGAGHERLSSHVEHRANILALREAGVDAIFAATVCGAVDRSIELGGMVVFDDLHFLANRLPDGALCSLYEPGEPGRGHWVFERPFSEPLRQCLLRGTPGMRDGGCYGHVDGPRFNSAAEIRMLAACGVSAVSQTAGPETVLSGEAEIPYALIGYATDYANGVKDESTPISELAELIERSSRSLAGALAGAIGMIGEQPPGQVGSHFRFE
ncbi:MAG: MTAP family purine nucleoside phosphorylase [Solirubrobacteraceae bacterium]